MRLSKYQGEYALIGITESPGPGWRWSKYAGPRDEWGNAVGAWLTDFPEFVLAFRHAHGAELAVDAEVQADLDAWVAMYEALRAKGEDPDIAAAQAAGEGEDGGESNPRGPRVPVEERFNYSPWGEGDDGYRNRGSGGFQRTPRMRRGPGGAAIPVD